MPIQPTTAWPIVFLPLSLSSTSDFLSPAAYGFLTAPDPNATITVQGSALSVPAGQSISLVGGKVIIQGAPLPDGTTNRLNSRHRTAKFNWPLPHPPENSM